MKITRNKVLAKSKVYKKGTAPAFSLQLKMAGTMVVPARCEMKW